VRETLPIYGVHDQRTWHRGLPFFVQNPIDYCPFRFALSIAIHNAFEIRSQPITLNPTYHPNPNIPNITTPPSPLPPR
jgi:hypothetical protein